MHRSTCWYGDELTQAKHVCWTLDKIYNEWWVWTEGAWGRLICRWLSDILSMRKKQGGKEHTFEQIAFVSPSIEEDGLFCLNSTVSFLLPSK